MKQSFINTLEVQNSPNCIIYEIFLREYALNSPIKPVVAKLLFLFLYLYNIICEIFKEKIWASILQNALSYSIFYNVLGDYALTSMLVHLGLRSGAPNSAKFRGGCRGPSKIRQKGGCNNFFTFYALKLELFRVFTLSD